MNTSLFEAPSASNTEIIRREIKARGLTQSQAAEKYGLGPDMLDWLAQSGISFAPEGARPQGLMDAAQAGRNGDTMMAHVTPGEKVIPREIAQGRPDLMANVERAIAQEGSDPSKYTVGAGRINPNTGVQEFASEPKQVQDFILKGMENGQQWQDIAKGAWASGITADEAIGGVASLNPGLYEQGSDTYTGMADAVRGAYSGFRLGTDMAAPPVTTSNAQASGATSQGYGATDAQASLRAPASLWEVDKNSTVQGQIGNITDAGGPLMQRAQTRALQDANKKGLANSTMAVQAGQAALYDAALPIAQQDANTYAQSGQFNAGAQNEASQFNAGTQTQVNLSNAAERNKAGAFTADASNRTSMFNAENATRNSQFNASLAADVAKFNASESNDLTALGMDSRTKLSLAEIEANYKTLMQTSASGSELYKSAISSMSQILQNTEMDEAAKRAALENITAMLNASLGVVGQIANLNLPELDFTGLAPEPTPTPTPAPTGLIENDPGNAGPGNGSI